MGMIFKERFVWTLGGEYWMKQGDELSGSYFYSPVATSISDPRSELKVYGVTTGLQYYLMNPPPKDGILKKMAVRSILSLGYYHADWDLWTEYANLNLATSTSTGNNTTFAGDQRKAAVAMDADGDFVIVWEALNVYPDGTIGDHVDRGFDDARPRDRDRPDDGRHR